MDSRYTQFSLEGDHWSPHIEAYIEERRDEDEFEGIAPDGESMDWCSWANHEADMRKMSRLFNGTLFTLHGRGDDEESIDLWRKYFLAGRMQTCRAEITFPLFHAGRLD